MIEATLLFTTWFCVGFYSVLCVKLAQIHIQGLSVVATLKAPIH